MGYAKTCNVANGHLTGSAELITKLNLLGHDQSYIRPMELETSICNIVTASETVLQNTKSANNNSVIYVLE